MSGLEHEGLERVSPTRRARLIAAQQAAGVTVKRAWMGGKGLRYAIKPGVGEPLLFCNGIGANLELTFPLLKALGPRPVVVLDMPGAGGSEVRYGWPCLRGYARLSIAVLDHAGFRGRFAVAGVSWGGALAQRIARDYAERVSHLVLMATSPGMLMVPGKLSALLRMATPRRYLSRGYMAKHAADIYGGEMRGNPHYAAEHARLIMPPRALAYGQQVMAMFGFCSLPWLHQLRCPTLVISGDDDPLIHVVNARVLARLVPESRLHIVKGGGHLFMTMRARETAELIEGWICPGTQGPRG